MNSKDQNELNNIKIQLSNTEHLKRIKEAIFTFSCCLHDDKNIVNKKLWENYGQVALVFEFCNEAKSWDKFHFSQVFYQENVSAFNEYFDLVERNKNEYNIDFYFESVFKLGAFYKIPELSWENEVRLLYNKDWSSNSENIYNDFTVSNYHTGITKYIEIPLYIDEKIETVYLTDPELRLKSKFKNDSVPHIKIKQLIFGDNEPLMNQDKFSNVRFGIKSYVESRLGYSIDIPNQLFETGLKIN
ncbi:MAG: hypothetical protein SFY32_09310 [Bacteroidota bacterium]|nr:hypothetical protein [Bacteroidota bacterium]